MNGYYNGENDDSDEESPRLLLMSIEMEEEQPIVRFDPSIFELVMTSVCAVLMFIGVNLRIGAHSILQVCTDDNAS